MERALRATLAACASMICQPVWACNTEGYELPWDLQDADKVLVGKITNYRIVPNEAEGFRLKQAVESGVADSFQKRTYEERLSKGLPAGGIHGLFDMTVKEVLKGKSSRKITVIFPDDQWAAGQTGDDDPSMLPKSLPEQYAIIGLRVAPDNLYDAASYPRVITNGCKGVMLFGASEAEGSWLQRARSYFGAKRRH